MMSTGQVGFVQSSEAAVRAILSIDEIASERVFQPFLVTRSYRSAKKGNSWIAS